MAKGMKVLTVKNPWADWIIRGLYGGYLKTTENRNWETKFRGRIMIHVAKGFDQAPLEQVEASLKDLARWEKQKGHIIGTVELYATDREMKTQWDEPGLFHWRLKNPLPLKNPVQARGRLGLWNYEANYG
jgi:hypothetical protein